MFAVILHWNSLLDVLKQLSFYSYHFLFLTPSILQISFIGYTVHCWKYWGITTNKLISPFRQLVIHPRRSPIDFIIKVIIDILFIDSSFIVYWLLSISLHIKTHTHTRTNNVPTNFDSITKTNTFNECIRK